MENQKDNKANQSAALLIIGNEILSGRTADANTRYIGEKLALHGVPLSEVRVVPDIEERIIEALDALRKSFSVVFTTGGLGPTHDDITAECVAKAFGDEYGVHEEACRILEDYYGKEEFTEARKKMAMMPLSAKLIPNPVSGAPGFIMENVFVMAGIPRIMQGMFDHVLSVLSPGEPILSNSVGCSLPESIIAEQLSEVQKKYPQVDIGSYPHFRSGMAGVNIVLRSQNSDALKFATKDVIAFVSQYPDEPRTMSFQVLPDD
jgi:molybdenum cofactor synthesis domain-containing protein